MPDINEIRKQEMEEIADFYAFIEEYGHIFYGENKDLEEPFKKILEGISEIRKIIDSYYGH